MYDFDKNEIYTDHRGSLLALEYEKNIKFSIERVFYIFGNTNNELRGQHAHFKTKQYIIALQGSCLITLNDGSNTNEYHLTDPRQCVFQDAMVWGTMSDFSENCILTVIASEKYDPKDYIHDYNEFLKLINSCQ